MPIKNYIKLGNCLDLMDEIPPKSINMILCDLPYGVTKNKWDSVIPLDQLWDHYRRIIKPNAAICLFADGMFQANLMLSNPKWWRYNLVWDKVLTSGFLNANRMPLRSHEEICVFYQKQPTYNPQKVVGEKNHSKGKPKENANNNYGDFDFVDNSDQLGNLKHPKSILTFPKPHPSVTVHPTQKSLELCQWLIRTYTNPGDIVLDNCMGSGTSCLAAKLENRHYIGLELSPDYFKIAEQRLSE